MSEAFYQKTFQFDKMLIFAAIHVCMLAHLWGKLCFEFKNRCRPIHIKITIQSHILISGNILAMLTWWMIIHSCISCSECVCVCVWGTWIIFWWGAGVQPEVWNHPFLRIFLPQKMAHLMVFQNFRISEPTFKIFLPQKWLILQFFCNFGEMGPSFKDFFD